VPLEIWFSVVNVWAWVFLCNRRRRFGVVVLDKDVVVVAAVVDSCCIELVVNRWTITFRIVVLGRVARLHVIDDAENVLDLFLGL